MEKTGGGKLAVGEDSGTEQGRGRGGGEVGLGKEKEEAVETTTERWLEEPNERQTIKK